MSKSTVFRYVRMKQTILGTYPAVCNVKCLAQGHNTLAVGFGHSNSQSNFQGSTVEPQHIL